MRTTTGPSLRELDGQTFNENVYKKTNYLKNIRDELMEEVSPPTNNNNNQIIFITAELQGVMTEVMVDTGANISLTDKIDFNRIKETCKENIPTLPVSNMVIVGATGRANKSVRKQVQIEVSSEGNMIPVAFLVAQGAPFKVMIGCVRYGGTQRLLIWAVEE